MTVAVVVAVAVAEKVGKYECNKGLGMRDKEKTENKRTLNNR
jgi:hypothetical protein